VRALIRPTLGAIEESADQMIAETSDPVVRRGALLLKIEMSTTMLAAMLRSDPVLALADAWGYVLQVEDQLKGPVMKAKYGEYAPKAAEVLASIEREFLSFVSSVQAGPFAESLEASVREWADHHPIEGALYRRPSMDSAVAKKLAASGDGGVFSALGSLEETTADVMTRMDLYTMYLPRLARWEAELAADDLMRGVDARTLSADFAQFTRAADRFATVAETASDLAARERTTVLEAVQSERLAVLDAVRKERIATLRELEAIAQRLADRSGPALNDAVRADMKELLSSVEEMRKGLIADTGERLEHVVDHAFLRLAQLLLICIVLAALGLMLRSYLRR
jgi:hypothetical protein